MKKLLLPISLLAVTFGVNAQTYFSDDFSSGNLNNWTLTDSDGDGSQWMIRDYDDGVQEEHASSASWNPNTESPAGALNPDNWMVSSAIAIPGGATNVRLVWKVYGQDQSYADENYTVYVANAADIATLGASSTNFNEVVGTSNGYELRLMDLSAFAGQTVYVGFRHHNVSDQFRLNIDDVEVKSVPNDEIALTSVNNASFVAAGNVDINYTVTNLGLDPITAFDVTYNDGSGDVTDNVTGVNIPFGGSQTFDHGTQWAATAGSNVTMNVSVAMTGDVDAANNSLSKAISVASGSGTKLPLAEVFTSSTCPPCFSLNVQSGYDGNGLDAGLASINANSETNAQIAAIKWQVNWPGSGDHAYNAEVGSRVTYYGVNGAPTQVMDGDAGTAITPASLASYTGNLALVDIDAEFSISGNDIDVTATVTPYINMSNARVMIALLEEEYDATSDGSFSNGETKFHNVFRKALPDVNGTTANLVDGTDYVVNESYTRTVNTGLPAQGSFDFHSGSTVQVVVFVEDASTQTVLNAAVAKNLTAGIDEQDLNFGVAQFPNPTTGMSHIVLDLKEQSDVNIQVLDLQGQVVFQNEANVTAGQNMFNVDLSNQAEGLYIANISVNGQNKAIKINVAK